MARKKTQRPAAQAEVVREAPQTAAGPVPFVDQEEPATDPAGVAGEYALVTGSEAMIRAGHEAAMKTARLYPRDPKACLVRLMKELRTFPDLARTQFYHLEFKMDSMPGKATLDALMADGKVVQRGGEYYNIVEEVGVHGAAAMGRAWGNVSVRVIHLEDRAMDVLIQGTAVDLETGFAWEAPLAISKYYHSRRLKKMVPWRADRLPMVIQAGAAKAARNALLRVLPMPMRVAYLREAQALNAAQLVGTGTAKRIDYASVIPRVLDRFRPLFRSEPQMDEAAILAAIEKRFGKGIRTFTRDDFISLAGIGNAIEHGEVDLYQALGVGGPPAEEKPPETPAGPSGSQLRGEVVKEEARDDH